MMKNRLALLCCIVFVAAVPVPVTGCITSTAIEGPVHLTVLHTNDTHAHLDMVANRCTLTSGIRSDQSKSDILLLDAGDVFAGTPYFSLYKGQADLWYMRYLQYDAMCLGNHEFDKGPGVLADFIDKTGFPVLCANFDFSKESTLAGKIKPWVVIERGRNKYGVFGLTTEEAREVSFPGPNIGIDNRTIWARKAVEYFKGQGVNKIIALTHIGYDDDLKLAQEVEGIDIIIGGHSHTVPENYPAVVNKFNSPTVVVQAGCYNRYLGRFDVVFNSTGEIIQPPAGKLLAVDTSIAPDQTALNKLNEYKSPIDAMMQKAAGCTRVALDGEGQNIRTRETNLGNLVADALLERGRYINAEMALVNSGAIRTSVPAGDITYKQIYEILPFDNSMMGGDMTGEQIIAALENALSQVEAVKGRFAQVSGLRFKWDAAAAPGRRILSTEVLTPGGYKAIETEKTYRVIFTDFMASGGDGYADIKAASNQINLGYPLTDVLAEYLVQHSPVDPQVEGRIIRLNGLSQP